VLLLQARTWVLFLMAGASRQQGDALLNLFYPDHDNFWLGLLPGMPAVLAFIISGHRQRFPGSGGRCAGCWCFPSSAVALAAAAVAERRVASALTIGLLARIFMRSGGC
jgi:hypothetical protein